MICKLELFTALILWIENCEPAQGIIIIYLKHSLVFSAFPMKFSICWAWVRERTPHAPLKLGMKTKRRNSRFPSSKIVIWTCSDLHFLVSTHTLFCRSSSLKVMHCAAGKPVIYGQMKHIKILIKNLCWFIEAQGVEKKRSGGTERKC